MLKRINFTGRIKILREDVSINVTQETGKPAVFKADLHLQDYGLPLDALIRIEAYRESSWMGFELGTIGAPDLLGDHELTEFGDPEGVKFRLRIVSGDPHRRVLLAAAEGLTGLEPGVDGREPLLPVLGADLGPELWQLVAGSAPLLKVNKAVPNWRAVAKHPIFVGLVYPNVFRQLLTEAVENEPDLDDGADAFAKWIRFAQSLPNVTPFDPRGDKLEWVDEVVKAFCRAERIMERFAGLWKEIER